MKHSRVKGIHRRIVEYLLKAGYSLLNQLTRSSSQNRRVKDEGVLFLSERGGYLSEAVSVRGEMIAKLSEYASIALRENRN